MLVIKEIIGPKTASDKRQYKTIYFQEEPEMRNGRKVISNEPLRARNVWDTAPDYKSRGDNLFYDAEKGAMVPGKIETVPVEQFFIPSENGNDTYNGKRGNWVSQYTTPVFSHENPLRIVRSQGHTPIDPETQQPISNNGEVVESEDIAVSNDQKVAENVEEEGEGDQSF